MIKSRIITYLSNDQALKWGLDFLSINSPISFLIHPSLKSIFDPIEKNENTEIFYCDFNDPIFFSDTLKMIMYVKSNTKFPTERFVFITDSYLYKYLSFEFIYSNHLIDYIENNEIFNVDFYHYLPHDTYFYNIDSSKVYKLLNELKSNEKNLQYHFTKNSILTYKTEKYTNFNTEIAQFIAINKIHLIGDHHVLNTFTPNQEIGCRSDILFRHFDSNNINKMFMTHFFGDMTMVNFLKTYMNVDSLIEKLKVNELDICCFHFGELDVRSTLLKDGFSYDEAINLLPLLISKFVEKIKVFATHTNTIPIIIGVPAPFKEAVYDSISYPMNGSINQRLELTLVMNINLIQKALENNLNFFNPYTIYSNDNGLMSENYSDKTVYLNPELSCQNRENLLNFIQTLNSQ